MPVPIQLPPPPQRTQTDAEGMAWNRWFQQVAAAIVSLASARSYEVLVPATGFSHTIPVNTGLCLLTPAGALATGTLVLPAKALDGFEQQILSTQTVTTLTVSPSVGQTITGTAVFALAAGVQAVFRWRGDTAVWYRMQ